MAATKKTVAIYINPGSGKVKSGSKKQSEENMKQFIADLGVEAQYEFLEIDDMKRHVYKLSIKKRTHEIKMPAIPLKDVRYLGHSGQNIWDFPRLYIDGSSWIWKYALDVLS